MAKRLPSPKRSRKAVNGYDVTIAEVEILDGSSRVAEADAPLHQEVDDDDSAQLGAVDALGEVRCEGGIILGLEPSFGLVDPDEVVLDLGGDTPRAKLLVISGPRQV